MSSVSRTVRTCEIDSGVLQVSNGYLAGAFDLLNVADLDAIDQVRGRCERLVLGVYTDEYVQHLTGRPPVVPLSERLELTSHVRGVDAVVVHDHDQLATLHAEYRLFETAEVTDQADPSVEQIIPQRRTASRELQAALAPVAAITTVRESGVA